MSTYLPILIATSLILFGGVAMAAHRDQKVMQRVHSVFSWIANLPGLITKTLALSAQDALYLVTLGLGPFVLLGIEVWAGQEFLVGQRWSTSAAYAFSFCFTVVLTGLSVIFNDKGSSFKAVGTGVLAMMVLLGLADGVIDAGSVAVNGGYLEDSPNGPVPQIHPDSSWATSHIVMWFAVMFMSWCLEPLMALMPVAAIAAFKNSKSQKGGGRGGGMTSRRPKGSSGAPGHDDFSVNI